MRKILFLLIYLVKNVTGSYKMVCYFTNWAQYRHGIGQFWAEDIDPYLCTHVIYAFAKVTGNTIDTYEWNDINPWGKGQYEMAMELKRINPELKILLAIGGWNHGSGPFTAMVSSQSNIDEFSINAVKFLRGVGFDGLDLDWEYPANRGSPPEDKQRFTSLVQSLRRHFDNEILTGGQSRLLLTAAVSAGKSTIETAYEVDKISLELDMILLMSYDYPGSYTETSHNSPLYSQHPYNNVNYSVNMWLDLGAPKDKLIMGIAAYGRTFTLQSTDTTLGAQASGRGEAGLYTRESGFLSYYEICYKIKNDNWTEGWLKDQQVPYAYWKNQWVGFDNVASIIRKTDYIMSIGLGGAMVWAVDLDDFGGNCGGGKHPLIGTLSLLLNTTLKTPMITTSTTSNPTSKSTINVTSPTRVQSTPSTPTTSPLVVTETPSNSTDYGVYKMVCYFTNWAQYRHGIGQFWAKDIDPYLCTHVIYAFAKVHGNSIDPYEWNDINPWGVGQYEMAMELKRINPELKILLAIGGWNHGSGPFTAMVSSQSNIDEFSINAVKFLRGVGFDGLDLDWEYPANRGSPPEDRERFTALVQTLRRQFDNEILTAGQSRLLLTAAVSAGQSTVDTAYQVDKISKDLDLILLMSYDYPGEYTKTTHNSPLYSQNSQLNVDYSVNMWLNRGTPKHKLVVGIAAYGRTFRLQSDENGLDAPAVGRGDPGLYTGSQGFLAYYEICSKIKNDSWVEVWLEDEKVPYAYYGSQWVGFDNIKSVEIKAQYIVSNRLGGAMLWALDLDDFHGNCGHGKHPLVNTVNAILNVSSEIDHTMTSTSYSATKTGTDKQTSSVSFTTTESPGASTTKTGPDQQTSTESLTSTESQVASTTKHTSTPKATVSITEGTHMHKSTTKGTSMATPPAEPITKSITEIKPVYSTFTSGSTLKSTTKTTSMSTSKTTRVSETYTYPSSKSSTTKQMEMISDSDTTLTSTLSSIGKTTLPSSSLEQPSTTEQVVFETDTAKPITTISGQIEITLPASSSQPSITEQVSMETHISETLKPTTLRDEYVSNQPNIAGLVTNSEDNNTCSRPYIAIGVLCVLLVISVCFNIYCWCILKGFCKNKFNNLEGRSSSQYVYDESSLQSNQKKDKGHIFNPTYSSNNGESTKQEDLPENDVHVNDEALYNGTHL